MRDLVTEFIFKECYESPRVPRENYDGRDTLSENEKADADKYSASAVLFGAKGLTWSLRSLWLKKASNGVWDSPDIEWVCDYRGPHFIFDLSQKLEDRYGIKQMCHTRAREEITQQLHPK